MRAKEYIHHNRTNIKHIDLVERIISDLSPLRMDKKKTDEYYNKVLSSDIRKQTYLLQVDLYDKCNAMQQEEPRLETFEGEVPYEIAADVRATLFQILKEDKSFGYVFFQLGNEHNSKHSSDPIDCIPNHEAICKAISTNRDCYPHGEIASYLDDDFNYDQNEMLLSNGYSENEPEKLTSIFNLAYETYDVLRCRKSSIAAIKQQLATIMPTDDLSAKDISYALEITHSLISEYSQEDKAMERVANEILKKLSSLGHKKSSSIQEKTDKGMTTQQQILFMHYILNELGVNFGNSDKAAWKRLISKVFGKNSQDVKEKLTFDYDDKKTKSSLRIVSEAVKELLPSIADKINNDIKE